MACPTLTVHREEDNRARQSLEKIADSAEVCPLVTLLDTHEHQVLVAVREGTGRERKGEKGRGEGEEGKGREREERGGEVGERERREETIWKCLYELRFFQD